MNGGKGVSYNLRMFVNLAEYILVILLIMECNSLYALTIFSEGGTQNYFKELTIGISVFLLVCYVIRERKLLRKFLQMLIFIGTLMLYALIFYCLNVCFQPEGVRNQYLTQFMIILPLMICLFWFNRKQGRPFELLYKHANVVVVYATASLMIFVIALINPDVMNSYINTVNWGGLHGLNSLFNVCGGRSWDMLPFFGMQIPKNTCFFPEPPMACIPLVTALYTEIYLKRTKRNLVRAILLSLTIITTGSSLAYVLTVAAWGMLILTRMRAKLCWKLMICAGTLLMVVAVIAHKMETGGGSFRTHIEDYWVSIQCFLDHWLYGAGYENGSAIQSYMPEYRALSNPGLSNSIAVVFALDGVVFGFFYIIPFLLCGIQVFRTKNRQVAFWAMGVFGLYVMTIFHYRYFMLFLLAFGYSLIDVRLKREGGMLYAGASVFPQEELWTQQNPEAASVGQNSRSVFLSKPYKQIWCATIALLVFVLLCTCKGIWSSLYTFFVRYQLFLTESLWKFPAAAIGAIETGLLVKMQFKRDPSPKSKWIACGVGMSIPIIYVLMMPRLVTLLHTVFELKGKQSDIYETGGLLFFYSLLALLLFQCKEIIQTFVCERRLAIKNCWGNAAAAVLLFAMLAIGIGGLSAAVKNAEYVPEDLEILREALAHVEGDVYAESCPEILIGNLENVKYSVSSGSAYAVYRDASIIVPHGEDILELFNSGFLITKLSEHYNLYTNNEAVIQKLKEQGYTFYPYYPYSFYIDLKEEAVLNGLTMTETGALLVEGASKSLIFGPYTNSRPGEYEAIYILHFVEGTYNENELLCTLRVSSEWGRNILQTQPITEDLLDEDGNYTAVIKYSTGEYVGMEYLVFAENETKVEISSIEIKKAPTMITIDSYNAWHKLVKREYFDANKVAVLCPNGYHEIRYSYNLKGKVIREEYYGTEGELIMNVWGYAVCEVEYGLEGSEPKKRYFDVNGNEIFIE